MSYISVGLAASRIGVARSTIHGWARDGDIACIRIDMGGGRTAYAIDKDAAERRRREFDLLAPRSDGHKRRAPTGISAA